ncbi:MAG TPA: hypothetical protein VEH55_11140 [Gaiellaceae bacterium]|nr:hypothetical protein [Gaiellaceae bacterium]
MGLAFYWARNDDIGGHVWLSDDDLRALTDEMVVQGMPWPAERVAAGTTIDADELEAVLDPAAAEPTLLADAKLWRDWLVFLDGATRNGGLLIRP